MNPIVIIPARMASTRLPGKPLADIAGTPMIVRVWRQAMSAGIGPVLVATAEAEIARAIENAGGAAVLTDPALPSGTDRVFAALEKFDAKRAHDVIVNLQGDLPLLDPAQLQIVVEALAASAADIATLAAPVVDEADVDNPNVVKPVITWNADGSLGRALNFTRARAPYGPGVVFHHIGIYAFRRVALARFVALAPSPLEQREKLEQLRALEAGMSIAVARVDKVPLSVDTDADLARVREAVARDAESSSHGSTSSP
jgi:3-deoxy-manno-octulosonate cytidylyltransferase (CMP-KDO synthetase)